MLTFPHYQITQLIYESNDSQVFRATRLSDNLPVIIKYLKEDYPSPSMLVRYQHEFDILSKIDLKGVIKVYELQRYHHTLFLVLEDIGGESLKVMLGQYDFTVAKLLELFIQVTEILANIHVSHLIHKDINPSNIIWNPDTGQVKIIDFGIATLLPRETLVLKNPNQLEGTLPYLSPEQTGRMNRSLDYRTDLYSLGVTLYEMFTGRIPFETTDAMELVHCHLAKLPTPPSQIKSHIPTVISNVILHLLAKTAEERYQSAWSVRADLMSILKHVEETGDMHHVVLNLGQQDALNFFHLPQHLYGRESELHELLATFERVCQGGSKLLLVAGYSGIGKTALVQEIYKPVTAKRGYFSMGKFDQYQRNVPYFALIQAFRHLMQQLLTESTLQIEQWQQRLLAVLEHNGKVISQVIPELEMLLGAQPEVLPLSPSESQSRFNLLFQKFVRVFCQVEHPLVIFLDDLQWADLDTLKLLELLVTDRQTTQLLIIGAYRDNEVDTVHPLRQMLDRLSQAMRVKQLNLAPLQLTDIMQLLTDTLRSHSDQSARLHVLAVLIMQKTRGNPFFVNQFLKMLYQQQLLCFDLATQQWHWDITQLISLNITDNVVDLMLAKLQQLPPETQETLQFAACIANEFNLLLLTLIENKSEREILHQLQPALREELLLPAATGEQRLQQTWYRFAHDRIQQAAYVLIPDTDKVALHVKIGRLLLEHTPATELDKYIFDIVHHLNFGAAAMRGTEECVILAKLNLLAGKKARQSAAYSVALRYLQIVVQCLETMAWEEHYDLMVEGYKACAEAEFLNSHFEQTQRLIELLEARLKTPLEKAEILSLLVVQQTIEAKYAESVETARRAFQLLGMELPGPDTVAAAFQQELATVKTLLAGREVASLLHLPENIYPIHRLAIQLCISLDPPTYIIGDLDLYMYICTKAVALSLQYGNVVESAKGYANYGLIIGSGLGDFKTGYQFGMLAVEVSKQFQSPAYESKVDLLLGSWIHSWNQPIHGAKYYNLEGYHAGMTSGEPQFAMYNLFGYITNSWVENLSLPEVQNFINEYLPVICKAKNDLAIDTVLGIQLCIFCLQGETEEYVVRYGETLSEADYQRVCINSPLGYATYCIFKAQVRYILEQYDAARACLETARGVSDSIFGFTSSLEYNFYTSLTLLANLPKVSESQQLIDLATVAANQTQLQQWAASCPENFLHRWQLVEAERARLNGQHFEAIEYYDQSIELAGQQGFIQNQALANELAAKFWLSKAKPKIAKIYLQEAYYCYQRWGAWVKLQQLEKSYPQWLPPQKSISSSTSLTAHFSTAPTVITATRFVDVSRSDWFDLASVMKAAQVLSEEIVLDKLLTIMMHTVIENAGAQRGVLILEHQGEWVIQAEVLTHQAEVMVLQALPFAKHLPNNLINYVLRTKRPVMLEDAQHDARYGEDNYIQNHAVKSLLCMPLLHQQQLVGIIYLENNLATGIFTPDRFQVLTLLSSQMAISLENAHFIAQLQAARQLAEAAQQAAETANHAKTAFLANVSHEFRTPLNGILGYAQILQHDSQLNEDQQEAVATIYHSGEHLLTLVNDILEISKLQTTQLELQFNELYLDKLLNPLVTVQRNAAEHKGLTFCYQPAAQLPECLMVDAKRLRQILLNLLSNAVKFTQQGKVCFQITCVPHNQQVGMYRFQFIVTDTGCGIAPQDLERIFMPFEQASRWQQKSEGVGLGLSLTKQLVDLMHGELKISSKVGQGSVVTVQLDLAEPVTWHASSQPSGYLLSTDEDLSIKGPTANVADQLHELALMGDFFGIMELANSLEQEDSALLPFATKILDAAAVFDDKSIRQLVQPFVTES